MPQNTVLHDDAISDVIFNERTTGWDTAFPVTWPANGWFWRTDTNIWYQNTGTEGTPIFTARTGISDHKHTAAGDGGKLDDTTIMTIDAVDETILDLILTFG